jgi:hypothetical protein
MSNHAYIGRVENVEFLETQQNSTKLNRTQQKIKKIRRSEWAKRAILKNNLKSQTFSKTTFFKSLSLKDQQAIRYQMRKVKDYSISTEKKEKVRKLPFSLQALTLTPIALTEMMVISLSSQFYLLLGLSGQHALSFAIAAEIFFMLSSAIAKTSPKFKAMSCLFLAYSIFTVAYSTYRNDSAVKDFVFAKNQEQKQKVLAANSILAQAEKRLHEARKKKDDLQKSLDVYIRHEQVTRGYKLLGERLKNAEIERLTAYSSLQEVTKQRAKLKNYNHVEIFSLPVLKVVNVSTWILIIGFILLQVSTALYMGHALEALKHLVPVKLIKKYI